jgi:hypothetical protein
MKEKEIHYVNITFCKLEFIKSSRAISAGQLASLFLFNGFVVLNYR